MNFPIWLPVYFCYLRQHQGIPKLEQTNTIPDNLDGTQFKFYAK